MLRKRRYAITGSNDPTDDNGHGTHVAGIIAAMGLNQQGGVGVAYNVKLMAIKCFDANGAGFCGEAAAEGQLATRELNTPLPVVASWWRELARRYLTQLCHTPDLAQAKELGPIAPLAAADFAGLIDSAPPMRGGEYLHPDLLATLWGALDALVRGEIARHAEGAGGWLREAHPLWRMVGRVSFHLAENKRHPTHPFAFMASYASRLSSQSRVQHLPLGRALQEYAGAKDKQALINLLSPIQKAAEMSA